MTDFRKELFLQLGIVSGVVLLLGGAILWLGSNISNRVMDLRNGREVMYSRKVAIESLKLLRSDQEKAGMYQSIVENALPSKDQLIVFSKDLETLARSKHLGFGFTFGTEAPATPKDPGRTQFKITFSGAYVDIVDFLAAAKKNRYLVRFSDLDLTQRGPTFEGSMNGIVFSR